MGGCGSCKGAARGARPLVLGRGQAQEPEADLLQAEQGGQSNGFEGL